MAKINLLTPQVYNRIAAGEVVERPCSVVKELVENAVDAGATEITISVYQGGISRIRVSDNGCGIEKSELSKVFLPHATSKIAKAEDLNAIVTLGFRGEALASIASVSQITVRSRTVDSEIGGEISSYGGVMSDVIDCASSLGTEITVDKLFFNTPVRAKFLKTERGEEGDISALINRLILGNPNIAFRYEVDGRLAQQSYGTGLQEAMIAVFGVKTLNECFYVDTVRNGVRVSGYIGKHHFTKPNRTYQSLFVNGRYVLNANVSGAIQNAYGTYLMKRQYPFYVLFLDLPTDEVDVNVHPNKTEVRFQNNQKIFGSVYAVISSVLDGTSQAIDIVKSEIKPVEITSQVNAGKPALCERELSTFSHAAESEKGQKPVVRKSLSFDLLFEDSGAKKEIAATVKSTMPAQVKPQIIAEEQSVEKTRQPTIVALKQDVTQIEKPVKQQQIADLSKEFLYAGQILNTYLLFERGEDVYLVDQHAAHEKLNYDAYLASVLSGAVATQQMLVPFLLSIGSEESQFVSAQIPLLTKMGFEIEEFGRNTFRVGSVPVMLGDLSLQKFFDSILYEDAVFKKETLPEILLDKIAQKACKASVKAGKIFTRAEAETLLKRMNGNMGLKCPHGRPVAVRISKIEIDKWFKRIV